MIRTLGRCQVCHIIILYFLKLNSVLLLSAHPNSFGSFICFSEITTQIKSRFKKGFYFLNQGVLMKVKETEIKNS